MSEAIIEALRRRYMESVGNPARQLIGGGVRGYLGLDQPEYADQLGREAYANAQALGNAPGIGAPAGAFKAMAAVPLAAKALSKNEAIVDALRNAQKFDLSLVQDGNKLRDYKVGNSTITLDVRPDVVKVSSLRTPASKRGQGSAREAMDQLVRQADDEGVKLMLDASPLDKKTSLQKLVDFYRSVGFEPTGNRINAMGDPEMMRLPRKRTD